MMTKEGRHNCGHMLISVHLPTYYNIATWLGISRQVFKDPLIAGDDQGSSKQMWSYADLCTLAYSFYFVEQNVLSRFSPGNGYMLRHVQQKRIYKNKLHVEYVSNYLLLFC